MFLGATSFNGDLSKWDVSSVSDMRVMFLGVALFKRELCTAAWVRSKTTKHLMFEDSSGSISTAVCTATAPPLGTLFSPESREELKSAVDAILEHFVEGDGSNDPHGPIGEWYVSRVTDMSRLFADANAFNADISKWDVSRVTDMSRMFFSTTSFNGDLSKWDVSSVTDMSHLFFRVTHFNGDISKWDVSRVKDMSLMFSSTTSFNGDVSKWDVSSVKVMSRMFLYATSFSGDVSKWNMSNVRNIDGMFWGSKSFHICS